MCNLDLRVPFVVFLNLVPHCVLFLSSLHLIYVSRDTVKARTVVILDGLDPVNDHPAPSSLPRTGSPPKERQVGVKIRLWLMPFLFDCPSEFLTEYDMH